MGALLLIIFTRGIPKGRLMKTLPLHQVHYLHKWLQKMYTNKELLSVYGDAISRVIPRINKFVRSMEEKGHLRQKCPSGSPLRV